MKYMLPRRSAAILNGYTPVVVYVEIMLSGVMPRIDEKLSIIKMVPVVSTVMPVSGVISAAVAGPRSPVEPDKPLPAMVYIVPVGPLK